MRVIIASACGPGNRESHMQYDSKINESLGMSPRRLPVFQKKRNLPKSGGIE
ncbi:hypothetical protein [Burkholderia plantarii]|uniref:hypothetical protein n=1 Tax=Burkholderia plantarii TaxID=41899 RepID=UPI0018DC9676|nr:hypothetical protein [Burkholderia plantarii]MBI0329947.1 hypothetical protein [Burkholderia plantarii]